MGSGSSTPAINAQSIPAINAQTNVMKEKTNGNSIGQKTKTMGSRVRKPSGEVTSIIVSNGNNAIRPKQPQNAGKRTLKKNKTKKRNNYRLRTNR